MYIHTQNLTLNLFKLILTVFAVSIHVRIAQTFSILQIVEFVYIKKRYLNLMRSNSKSR